MQKRAACSSDLSDVVSIRASGMQRWDDRMTTFGTRGRTPFGGRFLVLRLALCQSRLGFMPIVIAHAAFAAAAAAAACCFPKARDALIKAPSSWAFRRKLQRLLTWV